MTKVALYKGQRSILILSILVLAANLGLADSAVTAWNDVALSSVRGTKMPPPITARMLAILHTCMFDAWARYDAAAVPTQPGGFARRSVAEQTLANKQEAISFAAY